MQLKPDELARYSQQIKLSDIGIAGQIKLKNARVLCIGAGGLASPLLLYLAAAGIGILGIVDDDKVELSNLQRQILYASADVGSKKIFAAQEKLLALNADMHLITHPQRLDSTNAQELIAQYDIVADCSDNFATRYIVNDICHQLNKPFVFASISQFAGQCSTFNGNKGPCFRCLFPFPPITGAALDCNLGGVLGVVPGLLGVIQATEILKYLLNIGDLLIGRLLCVDTMTMQFSEFKLTHHPECQLCGQSSLSTFSKKAEHNSISPNELQQKLRAGESIFLLDVRSVEEHSAYHIGGMLIPLQELPERLSELNPNDEIVVYCHLGQRSLFATELLKSANFHRVRSLEGGLKAWQNQSF